MQLLRSGLKIMANSGTPLMRSSGQVPYIPTGYEGLQSQAATKRKIAESLLAAKMPDNARSWAQVLGHIAEAWAGKSLQKDADKADEQVRQAQLQANAVVQSGIEADVQSGMTPHELKLKWGGNPLAAERLKQFDQPMEFANGVAVNKYNVREGTQGPQNPTAMVIRDSQGNWQVNPSAVHAQRSATGLPVDGNATGTYPDPTGPAMGAYIQGQLPGSPEVKIMSDGTKAYRVNGEWYDNPEGK